jgi:hypothetical protein
VSLHKESGYVNPNTALVDVFVKMEQSAEDVF